MRSSLDHCVTAVAIGAFALLAGCAFPPTLLHDLLGESYTTHRGIVPDADAIVANAAWDQAERAHVVLAEYAFALDQLVFHEGKPYAPKIINLGNKPHAFRVPHFFCAIAVQKVERLPIG